jgi:hypothetical protein
MGILLVAGFAGLVLAISYRLSHSTATHATRTRSAAEPFTAAPVNLPPGARIEAISIGNDRLALAILLPDGNRELLLLDPNSGRRLGTIPLPVSP